MADSTDKFIRLVKEKITDHGGTITEVSFGRHVKIKFVNPHGVPRMLVVCVSPRDRLVEMKINQDIRKLMRAW